MVTEVNDAISLMTFPRFGRKIQSFCELESKLDIKCKSMNPGLSTRKYKPNNWGALHWEGILTPWKHRGIVEILCPLDTSEICQRFFFSCGQVIEALLYISNVMPRIQARSLFASNL